MGGMDGVPSHGHGMMNPGPGGPAGPMSMGSGSLGRGAMNNSLMPGGMGVSAFLVVTKLFRLCSSPAFVCDPFLHPPPSNFYREHLYVR